MSVRKMHADEADIDTDLVRRLLTSQFPQWADLPLRPVVSSGTDNAIFRLGDALAVRLPRIESAAGQVDSDHRWLPYLSPYLPLAVPAPVARGLPGEGYPWNWSVQEWLDGENATPDRIDLHQAALDLARLVGALQQIDTTGGPRPGAHNVGRGVPLANRDEYTREAIASLEGMLDTAMLMDAWEQDLNAADWDKPPVWIHGDIQSGNLLALDGRITALIDFGCLGIGDPAVDLIVAWNLLTADTREIFRANLGVDDATWARGRGWALSVSVVALPYYHETNPVLADISRYAISQVLNDVATS